MDLHQRPSLARGCRLREAAGETASIQIPEGALKMAGAGLEIIKLCDGNNTVTDILTQLKQRYPLPAHAQLETETLNFLERLQKRLILTFA